MFFSYILWSFNYTLGDAPFHSETWKEPEWLEKLADGRLSVVHKLKVFYDKPFDAAVLIEKPEETSN
jgi:hypothetical protein